MPAEHEALPPRPSRYRPRWPRVLLLAILAIVLGLNEYYQWYRPWAKSKPEPAPQAVSRPPTPLAEPKVIDYSKVRDKSDQSLGEMMEGRKEEFGLKKSVDMVVKPEEAIKVGQEMVTVKDILAQIDEQSGRRPKDLPVLTRPERKVAEEDLKKGDRPIAQTSTETKTSRPPEDFYGIYVVRAGDNLWDIHFAFLREYLKHRGIEVSRDADKIRTKEGKSPGVSRILKFAETMVYIYNMKTRRLDRSLDLIEPETKIVIFNISQIHRILGNLTPGLLDQITFDGKNIFLPGAKP